MALNTIPPTGSPAPPLAVGAEIPLTIDSMGAGGMGIARHEGFTVLVPRGLPGERVTALVHRVHPRYAEAHVLTVQAPSPHRVPPPCPHFSACGGCDWQHLAYPAQLEHKRRVVEDQLRRIGGLDELPAWNVIPAPEPYGYRDRLEFSLTATEEGWAPAFHGLAYAPSDAHPQTPGHSGGEGAPLTPIRECLLAPPEFVGLARTVAHHLRGSGSTGSPAVARITVQRDGTAQRDATAPGGGISQGESTLAPEGSAGEGSGLALLLHVSGDRAGMALLNKGGDLVQALQAAEPALTHVAAVIRPPGERRRREVVPLLGGDTLSKKVGAGDFAMAPDGFFQVHPRMAAILCEAVQKAVEASCPLSSEPETAPPLLFDLYSGVGLFTLPLAARGYRVAGVDLDKRAVRIARDNARRWGSNRERFHCKFHCADLGQPGELRRIMGSKEDPALIIADPPRQGLARAVVDELLRRAPAHLLYVSCDSGTFARDAARLSSRYRLEELNGFDMFPQTHHVELLGRFRVLPE